MTLDSALIAAIVALAGAVGTMFGLYVKAVKRSAKSGEHAEALSQKLHADHEGVISALRAEYEEKHRRLAEDYAKQLRDERDANREHEDLARKEFAELMETVSRQAERSSESMVELLQKFLDRMVGGRSRGY